MDRHERRERCCRVLSFVFATILLSCGGLALATSGSSGWLCIVPGLVLFGGLFGVGRLIADKFRPFLWRVSTYNLEHWRDSSGPGRTKRKRTPTYGNDGRPGLFRFVKSVLKLIIWCACRDALRMIVALGELPNDRSLMNKKNE
jgi:hypothetical protein